MASLRTFIAVDFDAEVRSRAAELSRLLGDSGADVKWVEPERMHLTLKFLGDVSETEIHRVCRAAMAAAESHGPFELTCSGAGAFPDVARPRTIWLGIRAGGEPLQALFQSVEQAMVDLGYPGERRGYKPHLTIGRLRRGGPAVADLSKRLAAQSDFDAGGCRIEEVKIYASFLNRSGPTYEVLGRAPLSAGS